MTLRTGNGFFSVGSCDGSGSPPAPGPDSAGDRAKLISASPPSCSVDRLRRRREPRRRARDRVRTLRHVDPRDAAVELALGDAVDQHRSPRPCRRGRRACRVVPLLVSFAKSRPATAAKRLVARVLEVVAERLARLDLGLAAAPEAELGAHLAGLLPRHRAPDVVVGVELVADAIQARLVGRRRATQRERERLERLVRLGQRPSGRQAHARPQRLRQRVGLVVDVVRPDGQDVDGRGLAVRGLGDGLGAIERARRTRRAP